MTTRTKKTKYEFRRMRYTTQREQLIGLDECERIIAACLHREPSGGFITQERIDAASTTPILLDEYYLYCLYEPGYEEDVRYVGVTIDPDGREKAHNARQRNPKGELYKWIAELHANGLRPGFRVIASVIGQHQKAEQEAILQWKRWQGKRLFNLVGAVPAIQYQYPVPSPRKDFERIARWAIRRAIKDDLLSGDSTKADWWKYMEVDQ